MKTLKLDDQKQTWEKFPEKKKNAFCLEEGRVHNMRYVSLSIIHTVSALFVQTINDTVKLRTVGGPNITVAELESKNDSKHT